MRTLKRGFIQFFVDRFARKPDTTLRPINFVVLTVTKVGRPGGSARMSKTRKPPGTHLSVEALEGREGPSTASLSGGVLTINGTDAGEAITVKLEGWQVRVSDAAILD